MLAPGPRRALAVALAVFLVAFCCRAAFATPAGAPDAHGKPPTPTCRGKRATIVRLGPGARVRGSVHADVIVTGAGDDTVEAGGGDDTICTRGGDDAVRGGPGHDRVDAGSGDDVVEGENGTDEVRGESGSDRLIGGRGNDQLDGGPGNGDFIDGGLGDDTLRGGAGDFDRVLGRIGNDLMYGGPGNGDYLRGDFGDDLFDGGPGAADEASFAFSGRNSYFDNGGGVTVELGPGVAYGDGNDRLAGIENVVGSPLQDKLVGNAEPNVLYGAGGQDILKGEGAGDIAYGGAGSDVCAGFVAEDGCGPEAFRETSRLEVDLAGGAGSTALSAVWRPRDVPIFSGPSPPGYKPEGHVPGIEVDVGFEDGAWIVREGPLPIATGDRCQLVVAGEARCPIAGVPDGVFIDGSLGDDRLTVDPSVPAQAAALIVGEKGIDVLIGGAGDDSIDGGPFDSFVQNYVDGGGGDDALTGEGALHGGPGSDLLIAEPCDDQVLDGGAGPHDSVSFARSQAGVDATLGGEAVFPADEGQPAECGRYDNERTMIEATVELIEGSAYDDILGGDSDANTILGRAGDDEVFGGGGDDLLVGGGGRDELAGGSGFDRLYLADGTRDAPALCGNPPVPGGVARLDASDPAARGCKAR